MPGWLVCVPGGGGGVLLQRPVRLQHVAAGGGGVGGKQPGGLVGGQLHRLPAGHHLFSFSLTHTHPSHSCTLLLAGGVCCC